MSPWLFLSVLIVAVLNSTGVFLQLLQNGKAALDSESPWFSSLFCCKLVKHVLGDNQDYPTYVLLKDFQEASQLCVDILRTNSTIRIPISLSDLTSLQSIIRNVYLAPTFSAIMLCHTAVSVCFTPSLFSLFRLPGHPGPCYQCVPLSC